MAELPRKTEKVFDKSREIAFRTDKNNTCVGSKLTVLSLSAMQWIFPECKMCVCPVCVCERGSKRETIKARQTWHAAVLVTNTRTMFNLVSGQAPQ